MTRNHSTFARAIALASLLLAACAAEVAPAENDVASAGQELGGVGYSNPPRCGPRNCVATCVTCYYDICRIYGGTAAECNVEKQGCIDECNQGQECQPGAPCDCGSGDPTHCN